MIAGSKKILIFERVLRYLRVITKAKLRKICVKHK